MSKGSKQRPTDMKKYANNYDAIFGKDQKLKQKSMTELNWDGDEDEKKNKNKISQNSFRQQHSVSIKSNS